MIKGGCLCKAIRYEVRGVLGQAVCHCTHCQRQGGSAFSVLARVAAAELTLRGQTKIYVDHGDSGAAVNRHFCADCGSPIYSELPDNAEFVFLKAGTLDDTSVMEPSVHVWVQSAWQWTLIPAGSTILEQQGAKSNT